jgi:hypothetical protein
MKKPTRDKVLDVVSRQSVGSNNLFTSFNSVSGTVDLNISQLPKGIYLLNVQTQQGIVSRKIAVQ